MAANDPIYKQIEDSADYHQPATYDLLTFHNSMFETENDPLANDYVPLTGTLLPNKTQVIPFVIGLLPPTSPVTGRLLDRSASLAAMEGEGGGSGAQEGLPSPPSNPKGTKWSSQANPDDSFYADFVKWCKTKGLNPIDMIRVATSESGFNPSSKNRGPAGARGLWQFMPTTAVPQYMAQSTFDNFQNLNATQQLPYFRAFFSGLKSGASREEMYKYTFLPGATVGPDGTLYLPGGKPVSRGTKEYDSNSTLDVNRDGTITLSDLRAASDYKLNSWVEAGLIRALGGPAELDHYYAESAANIKLPIGGDAGGSNWATDGSDAASTDQAARTKAAGKKFKGIDRNQSEQGKKFQAQQRSIILALQIAEKQMAKTPPLRLLLNPESFKVASQKIISDGNWGRNGAGVGIEHWGDGQDVISASGKIAGFYAQDAVGTVNGSAGNSPGLTRMARAFSASYANFLSLYLIYRNNGGVWLEDFADSRGTATTKPNNLAVVGSVYIYYDSTLYVGSFNSFEMSEEDTGPFTLSYSFEFTVRATYLLDRAGATNPNPGTEYGYPNFPQSNPFSTPTATARTQPPATGASVAIPAGAKVTEGG